MILLTIVTLSICILYVIKETTLFKKLFFIVCGLTYSLTVLNLLGIFSKTNTFFIYVLSVGGIFVLAIFNLFKKRFRYPYSLAYTGSMFFISMLFKLLNYPHFLLQTYAEIASIIILVGLFLYEILRKDRAPQKLIAHTVLNIFLIIEFIAHWGG